MRELDIFDGHCDTLTACLLSGEGLLKNTGHLDLTRAMGYRRYAQFFALFGQPEDFPGQEISYGEIFAREHALFQRELAASGGAAVLCTTAAEAEAAFSAGKVATFLSVGPAEAFRHLDPRPFARHGSEVKFVHEGLHNGKSHT